MITLQNKLETLTHFSATESVNALSETITKKPICIEYIHNSVLGTTLFRRKCLKLHVVFHLHRTKST
jgi:hypothetical protein